MEPTFNLIYEPWIQVLDLDGDSGQVSLLDLFKHAQRFKSLAGELPTQDVAILRLLLAVMHAALAGQDVNGYPFPEGDEGKLRGSRKLWKDLWERGSFPWERIETYLKKYEDRFYLFHPTTPFFQAVISGKATEYSAYKLNGELSESENKKRLFPQRSGAAKVELDYAEAARWLLYVNGYDDTAAKPSKKGLPSPGAGWLGKLGLVTAVGDTLFATLMLNFILLRDRGQKLWGDDLPIWEVSPRGKERIQIGVPNNPAALYTLQSRRLLLKQGGNGKVVGFTLLGGDFFPKENAFDEPMTLWRNNTKKGDSVTVWVPRRHNPSMQMWRNFASLMVTNDTYRKPEIVLWLEYLENKEIISATTICLQAAGTSYGDKDFFIDDAFEDSISFSAALLHEGEQFEQWIDHIIKALQVTQDLIWTLGQLAQKIALSLGDEDGYDARDKEMEQAYFSLDLPFRQWLAAIRPEEDDIEEQQDKWWNTARSIVRIRGAYLARNSGQQAIVGRGDNNVPLAYNRFLWRTKNIENLEFKKGGKS
jgi:CRISPR system Cascade subunit CasA